MISLEAFLGSIESQDFNIRGYHRHHVSVFKQCHRFTYAPTYALKHQSNKMLLLSFSVTPSLIKEVQEYKPVVHRLRFSASP